MPSPRALHPNWRSSRCFLAGYAAAQLVAWLAVVASAMPVWLKLLCLLMLLWHGYWLRSRYLPLLTTSELRDLWWDGQRWCGQWPSGPAPLQWRGAVVRRWMVVLHFGSGLGRSASVTILPDQVSSEQFRALRLIAQHAGMSAGKA